MLRKDFLVKQLEEFGKVMAIILGARRENDWDKFEKEIRAAALKFTSLEIDEVIGSNLADFEKQIVHKPAFELDQKMILADLLFEKMNYYFEKQELEKYKHIRAQCLLLYSHIRDNFTQNEFNLNVHYKLEFLNKLD